MATRRPKLFLSCLVLAGTASSLAVSPDSPCNPACFDDAVPILSPTDTSRPSTPKSVCKDNEFLDTREGKTIRDCVSCLQTSNVSTSEKDDQERYIASLQTVVNNCSSLSEERAIATPSVCGSPTACGPLQEALRSTKHLGPEDSFAYCFEQSNAFLGENVANCVECLQATTDEKFLANFLIALQAACLQRPTSKRPIGVEGDLFSTTPVKITYPGAPSKIKRSIEKSKLSVGAIIGIAFGASTFLLSALGLLFMCSKRQSQKKNDARRESTLDSRFGSSTITSPNNGAFSNPYSIPRVNVKESFAATSVNRQTATPQRTKNSKLVAFNSKHFQFPKLQKQQIQERDTPLQTLSPASEMPIHPAYKPELSSPISPATTIATNTTWETSQPSTSAKASPRTPSTIFESYQTRLSPPAQIVQIPQLRRKRGIEQLAFSPIITTNLQSHPMERSDTIYPKRFFETTEPSSAVESSETFVPLSAVQDPTAAKFQTEQNDQTIVRARSGSRSHSRAPSYSRANAMPEERRRSTFLMGIGNANASQDKPLSIEGPVALRETRFDFAKAEKEERDREQKEGKRILVKRKREIETPTSPDEDEMWY